MNARRTQQQPDFSRPVNLKGALSSPYYQNVLAVMECQVGSSWIAAGTAGELYRRFVEANRLLLRENRHAIYLPPIKDAPTMLPSVAGSPSSATKHQQNKYIETITASKKPSVDFEVRLEERKQRAKSK